MSTINDDTKRKSGKLASGVREFVSPTTTHIHVYYKSKRGCKEKKRYNLEISSKTMKTQ